MNNTLVKARPEMHKKTFLKPVIKDSKFCSTCHKVGLPRALNHYKDFLRGQNHYDTFLLSGVSAARARSFYYPPKAKGQCVDCHMNTVPSLDFGARDFDGKGEAKTTTTSSSGPTPAWRPSSATRKSSRPTRYLSDRKVRVDIFALREGGIDGAFLGPLRPEVPTLEPEKPYLVEVVVRTLGLGHPFSQGTADSNEIWVELIAKAGDRVIGRSGAWTPTARSTCIPSPPGPCSTATAIGSTAGTRRTSSSPSTTSKIPPGRARSSTSGSTSPRRPWGRSRSRRRSHYRKFDRRYLDIIFGKGEGPDPGRRHGPRPRSCYRSGGTGGRGTNRPIPEADTWQLLE